MVYCFLCILLILHSFFLSRSTLVLQCRLKLSRMRELEICLFLNLISYPSITGICNAASRSCSPALSFSILICAICFQNSRTKGFICMCSRQVSAKSLFNFAILSSVLFLTTPAAKSRSTSASSRPSRISLMPSSPLLSSSVASGLAINPATTPSKLPMYSTKRSCQAVMYWC